MCLIYLPLCNSVFHLTWLNYMHIFCSNHNAKNGALNVFIEKMYIFIILDIEMRKVKIRLHFTKTQSKVNHSKYRMQLKIQMINCFTFASVNISGMKNTYVHCWSPRFSLTWKWTQTEHEGRHIELTSCSHSPLKMHRSPSGSNLVSQETFLVVLLRYLLKVKVS